MLASLFLFLLLFTTIASAYLYQRTKHEIHLVLSIFTAIVFLIWGLVIAHWSIHAFALLALLLIRVPNFVPKRVGVYEKF